tara:strand:- start:6814 stop:6999 length:186 start_codon:yes stop_codon:yes gene_type:complete
MIPFCTIPVCLVSLDYLNKSSELKKRNNNIIEFDKFIKQKEEGDAVDSAIAELLVFTKIAA